MFAPKRSIQRRKTLRNALSTLFSPENLTALFIEKQDSLAAEVPVSLVYNGIAHTVMMCSPQDLEDFALGFSLAEGIIEKKADIYGIDVVEVCNGIEVQIELSSRQFVALKDHRRTLQVERDVAFVAQNKFRKFIKSCRN